ncbi:hypothetical protein ACU686_01900 [Yinghuangia aomiensis]
MAANGITLTLTSGKRSFPAPAGPAGPGSPRHRLDGRGSATGSCRARGRRMCRAPASDRHQHRGAGVDEEQGLAARLVPKILR